MSIERVVLENAHLTAVFLPELGGKLASLVHRETGASVLLAPPEPDRGYRRAAPGAAFEDHDTSGFDECFPTVSACRYPAAPYEGVALPDHGELWSTPWACARHDDELVFTVRARVLPCALERRVRLEGSAIVLDYQLTSLATQAFHWMWSSHALLVAEPGSRLMLPPEVNELFVNWSANRRLGLFGDHVSWPHTGLSDLSQIGPPEAHTADKLFTPRLSAGWCALYRPTSGIHVLYRFDPAVVPYVGLWICQGGWPTSREAKHFTVALEPCTGRPDSLAEAIARGEADLLEPGAVRRWSLRMEIGHGRPDITSRREHA